MGIKAGKFQGGYDKSGSGKMREQGYRGYGTLKYGESNVPVDRKNIVAGSSELKPMPNGWRGRVLYSSKNKRIGRQEGTGPQS